MSDLDLSRKISRRSRLLLLLLLFFLRLSPSRARRTLFLSHGGYLLRRWSRHKIIANVRGLSRMSQSSKDCCWPEIRVTGRLHKSCGLSVYFLCCLRLFAFLLVVGCCCFVFVCCCCVVVVFVVVLFGLFFFFILGGACYGWMKCNPHRPNLQPPNNPPNTNNKSNNNSKHVAL